MLKKTIFILFIVSINQTNFAADSEVKIEFEKLKNISKKYSSPNGFLDYLVKNFGKSFNFSNDSESNQPGQRAILNNNEHIVLGINESSIEGVRTTNKPEALIPFNIHTKSGNEKLQTTDNPHVCSECHTKKWVFIWGNYNRWGSFLTYHFNDNDATYHKAFQNPIFKKLVNLDPKHAKLDGKIKSKFEFFLFESNVKYGRMAAEALWKRIVGIHPSRFKKYAPLLARTLFCSITETDTDYKSLMNDHYNTSRVSAKKWIDLHNDLGSLPQFDLYAGHEEVPKSTNRYRTEHGVFRHAVNNLHTLRVLNFLGVEPHQIILTKAWNGEKPTKSTTSYMNFMLQYKEEYKNPYYGVIASPFDFNLGDGTQLGDHLAWHLAQYLNIRVPDHYIDDIEKLHNRNPKFGYEEFLKYDKISKGVNIKSKDFRSWADKEICQRLKLQSLASTADNSTSKTENIKKMPNSPKPTH